MDQFVSRIHPRIENKYILITHNADHSAPGKFEYLLNDEKIHVWFGQNPTVMNHKKFIPIPIGIANNCWPHGNVITFSQVLKQKNSLTKSCLLALNFKPGNHLTRQPLYNYFIAQSFCTDVGSRIHNAYLINMARAKFTLSPIGNGLDCHRTWEALLMGSIPVLVSSQLNELLKDLPVLIVSKWEEVTEEFLNEKYQEMQNNWHNYNHDKMYFAYWVRLIESYKNN